MPHVYLCWLCPWSGTQRRLRRAGLWVRKELHMCPLDEISCFHLNHKPNSHCSLPLWVTLPDGAAVFSPSVTQQETCDLEAQNRWIVQNSGPGMWDSNTVVFIIYFISLFFTLSSFFFFQLKTVLTSLKKLSIQNVYESQMWWGTPLTTALERWKQED